MEGLEKQQMDKINELVDLKQTVTAEEQIKAFQWLKKNSDKIIKDTGMTPYVTFAIIFGIAMLFLR